MKNIFTPQIPKIGIIGLSMALISCDDDFDVESNTSSSSSSNQTSTESITSNTINVNISFQSNGPLGFAPILFTTHDGELDFFDTGSPATTQVETMAETGELSGLIGTLRSTDDQSLSTEPVAPSNSFSTAHTITAENSYFSYIGMALPSSDTFIGNNNPTQFDIREMLADANGQAVTIEVTNLYDAGTEVNDFLTSPGGALVGAPEGVAADGVEENGVITFIEGNSFASYLNPGDFDVSTIDPTGQILGTITITTITESTTATVEVPEISEEVSEQVNEITAGLGS